MIKAKLESLYDSILTLKSWIGIILFNKMDNHFKDSINITMHN